MQERGSSNLLYKEPCPACGSKDNLARYDDGHAYCFSPGCGHREAADGETRTPPRKSKERMDLLSGEVTALPARGLSSETCARYGYRVGSFKGQNAHLAPYKDPSGRVVAQKVRFRGDDGKKAFTWAGDPKEAGLFGADLLRADGGKMVVITEGEIDAMSVSQAMGNRWPVVSIPNGAGGAVRDLKPHIAALERYEKIVLCFDMDEPGRQAQEAAVCLFTPGKLHVALLPEGMKDASDLVKAGRSKDLVDAIWGASAHRPDGIRSVKELKAKALQRPRFGRPWPWVGFTAATYGIRPEIYSWGAGVGSGKTTTMKEIMLCTMRPDLLPDHGKLLDGEGQPISIPRPRKVGTFLFEETPEKTLRSLAGMALGIRVNKPDAVFTEEELEREMDTLDGLFFPFDTFGAKDWDVVKSQLLYLIQVEGVQDLWIDPLTALVAMAEDERRELDAVLADISGIVTTHGVTIHLVSHLTTPQGTPHEEGGRVMEKHFTGSRAIARWSHNMIGLERDKQSDKPTLLRGLKDREFGEATGPLLALSFHPDTGRMIEVPLSALEDEDGGSGFGDETAHGDI